MAEKKTTPIVIDDVEYVYEDMSDNEKMIVSHISDLERKINSAKFNLDQLTVGKDAFISILKDSLNKK